MNMSEFFVRERPETIVICPNCGGDNYESNRFEEAEAHCRKAASDVSLLLFEGRSAEARNILTGLYAVHIENILRPEHFCLSCGVTFDG